MDHHDDGHAPSPKPAASGSRTVGGADAGADVTSPDLQEVDRRLRRALEAAYGAQPPEEGHAVDAPGWLDLAWAAALAEDGPRAAAAAESGLSARGAEAPDCALALWRAAAVAADITGDGPGLERALQGRAALLRRLGRPVQARLETQLGAALLHEPDSFEATVLAGVVDQERERLSPAADTADTVLPEALTALSVARTRDGDHRAALELVDEALALLRTDRDAGRVLPWGSLSSAQLLRARLCLWCEDAPGAVEAVEAVLSAPGGRAVQASALLVRALAFHALQRLPEAVAAGLDALELMDRAGLRRGASSAAALVGRVLASLGAPESAALTAWEAAAVHAEKAEAPEAATLTYWWGHQLLMHGRAAQAAEVLGPLALRVRTAGSPVEEARALVDLGHARHELEETEPALQAWERAAELFDGAGQAEDAARTLLAAGALLNRQDETQRPRAQAMFRQAVRWARTVGAEDPSLLPAALHSLGYVTCELGDAVGLDALDEALELVRAAGSRWQEADYLDTRARCLWALRRGAEAVAAALQAADLFLAAEDRQSAAQAELFAAFVAAEGGDPETGRTLFSLLAEDVQAPHLVRLAALTGLQQCHEQLGDAAGAAAVRQRLEVLQEDPAAQQEDDPGQS